MRCPHCQFDGDPDDYAICTECGQPRLTAAPAPAPEHQLGGAAPFAAGPPAAPFGAPALGPQGRSARLVGIEGPVEGQEFPLDLAEMEIGRRAEAAIVVSDLSVSRRHARIRLVPGGCVIEDIGSANGTWVNGVRLSSAQPLFEKDVIRIGKAAFAYRSEAPVPAMPPGSQTMVSDLGDEPSPFGDDDDAYVRPAAPVIPAPIVDRPIERPIAPPPVERPIAPPPVERPVATPPAPTPRRRAAQPERPDDRSAQQAGAVKAALGEVGLDLSGLARRVEDLTAQIGDLEQSLERARSHASDGTRANSFMRKLTHELEDDSDPGQFRDLQHLLATLHDDPNNLKLLLRLSDELSTIERLVTVHLRVLALLRDAERDG